MKMKVRLGFVTNSSSTNHIMMWSGDKYDLKKILIEKINIFPKTYSNYSVDKSEILDAILSMIQSSTDQEAMRKELQEQLEWAKNWYDEAKQDGRKWSMEFAADEMEFIKELIELSKNKDWMLKISFGDNEGNFSGGNLGYVMDYEGRKIDVEEKNFVYKTKQNR
jgi:hypothetical protein